MICQNAKDSKFIALLTLRLKKPDQKQVSLILAALIPVLFVIGEGIFFLTGRNPYTPEEVRGN